MRKILLFLLFFCAGLTVLWFFRAQRESAKSSGSEQVEGPIKPGQMTELGAPGGKSENRRQVGVILRGAFDGTKYSGEGDTKKRLYVMHSDDVVAVGNDVYDLHKLTVDVYKPETDTLRVHLESPLSRVRITLRNGQPEIGENDRVYLTSAEVTLHEGAPVVPLVLRVPLLEWQVSTGHFSSNDHVQLSGTGLEAEGTGLDLDTRTSVLRLEHDGIIDLALTSDRGATLASTRSGPIVVRKIESDGAPEVDITASDGARLAFSDVQPTNAAKTQKIQVNARTIHLRGHGGTKEHKDFDLTAADAEGDVVADGPGEKIEADSAVFVLGTSSRLQRADFTGSVAMHRGDEAFWSDTAQFTFGPEGEIARADLQGHVDLDRGADHFHSQRAMFLFGARGELAHAELTGEPNGSIHIADYLPAETSPGAARELRAAQASIRGVGPLNLEFTEGMRLDMPGPSEVEVPELRFKLQAQRSLRGTMDAEQKHGRLFADGSAHAIYKDSDLDSDAIEMRYTLLHPGDEIVDLFTSGWTTAHLATVERGKIAVEALDGLQVQSKEGRLILPIARGATVKAPDPKGFEARADLMRDVDWQEQTFTAQGHVIFEDEQGSGTAAVAIARGRDDVSLFGVEREPARYKLWREPRAERVVGASVEAREIHLRGQVIDSNGDVKGFVDAENRSYRIESDRLKLELYPPRDLLGNPTRPFHALAEDHVHTHFTSEGDESSISCNTLTIDGILKSPKKGIEGAELASSDVRAEGDVKFDYSAAGGWSGDGDLLTLDSQHRGRLSTGAGRRVHAHWKGIEAGRPYAFEADWIDFDPEHVEASHVEIKAIGGALLPGVLSAVERLALAAQPTLPPPTPPAPPPSALEQTTPSAPEHAAAGAPEQPVTAAQKDSVPPTETTATPPSPTQSAATTPAQSAPPVGTESVPATQTQSTPPTPSTVPTSGQAVPSTPGSSVPSTPLSSVPSESVSIVPSAQAPIVPSAQAPIVPSAQAPKVPSAPAAPAPPAAAQSEAQTRAGSPALLEMSADHFEADEHQVLLSGRAHARGSSREGEVWTIDAGSIRATGKWKNQKPLTVADLESIEAWGGFTAELGSRARAQGERLFSNTKHARMEGAPAKLVMPIFECRSAWIEYDITTMLISTAKGELSPSPGSKEQDWSLTYNSLRPLEQPDNTILVVRDPVLRRAETETHADWLLFWIDRDEWQKHGDQVMHRSAARPELRITEPEPPPPEKKKARESWKETFVRLRSTPFGRVLSEAYLEGNVDIFQAGERMARASAVYLDLREARGWVKDADIFVDVFPRDQKQRLRVMAEWLRVQPDYSLRADKARITSCSFAVPDYVIETGDLEIVPGDNPDEPGWDVSARNNSLRLENGFGIPLPPLAYPANKKGQPLIDQIVLGDSAQFGASIRAAFNVPLGTIGLGFGHLFGKVFSLPENDIEGHWKFDAGFLGLRGVLLGAGVVYTVKDKFRMDIAFSGIPDSGQDKGLVRVPTDERNLLRDWFRLRGRYNIDPNQWIDFAISDQSDPGVQSEFYERDYLYYEQKDNYVHWRKAEDQYFFDASVKVLLEPRTDEAELPALNAFRGRTPIGELWDYPILYRAYADAAYLQRQNGVQITGTNPVIYAPFPDGLGNRDVARIDTDHRLEMPIPLGFEGLRVTPFAEVRGTAWNQAESGPESPVRGALFAGADVSTTLWKRFSNGYLNTISPTVSFHGDVASYESNPPPVFFDQVENPILGKFFDLSLRTRLWKPTSQEQLDFEFRARYGWDVGTQQPDGLQPLLVLGSFLTDVGGVPVAFTQDAQYNVVDGRTVYSNTAFGFEPHPRFDIETGYHRGDSTSQTGEFEAVLFESVSVGARYKLSAKWEMQFDEYIALNGNTGFSHDIVVRRLGHDFVLDLGISYREGVGAGFGFKFTPRFSWKRPSLGLMDQYFGVNR